MNAINYKNNWLHVYFALATDPIILFPGHTACGLLVHFLKPLQGLQEFRLCGWGQGLGDGNQEPPPVHVLRIGRQTICNLLHLLT